MAAERTRPIDKPQAAPLGAALAAIIGRRAEQQDAGKLSAIRLAGGRQALLMVVADGMGGHAGGAEASRVALSAFHRAFAADGHGPTARRLKAGLAAANAAIGERAAADPRLSGMGCTLVAAVLDGQLLSWISVGDTLLLAASGGRLRRLNADHSLGGVLDERAARGEITREEAMASEERHLLRAALTGERIALIDESEAQLEPGALVVAATDGVLTLPQDRLAALLSQAATPAAAVSAVLEAVSADMPHDQDNTTVAAARVAMKATAAPAARRRGAWRVLAAVLAFLVVLSAIGVLALVAWPRPPAEAPPPPAPPPVAEPEVAPEPPEPPPAATPDGKGKAGGFGTAFGVKSPRPATPTKDANVPRPRVPEPAASVAKKPPGDPTATTTPKPLMQATPSPAPAPPVAPKSEASSKVMEEIVEKARRVVPDPKPE